MKKNMLTASIMPAFFIIVLIFTNCSKQGTLTQDQTRSKIPDLLPGSCPFPCTDTRCKAYANGYCGVSSTTYDTVAFITNTNNPDEIAGQMHNNAMRSIMSNYNNGNLEPTQHNVYSYTLAFMINNHYDSATYAYSYNFAIQNNYYSFSAMPSIDSVATVEQNNGNISETAKNYMFRLSSLISSLSDSASNTVYTNFANQVIAYENQILKDNSLTSTEKNILLSAHAVARYSSDYWINYYNSQSSAIQSAQIQENSIRATPLKTSTGGGWFNWKDTIGDDVSGALGGAAGGALAGALAGGIGAGPGALAGAIGGGVGASAQNAAKQVWNHFLS